MVGLEVTVVQTGVSGFLASSSANFHIQHVFQAFHYLREQRAGPGLLGSGQEGRQLLSWQEAALRQVVKMPCWDWSVLAGRE